MVAKFIKLSYLNLYLYLKSDVDYKINSQCILLCCSLNKMWALVTYNSSVMFMVALPVSAAVIVVTWSRGKTAVATALSCLSNVDAFTLINLAATQLIVSELSECLVVLSFSKHVWEHFRCVNELVHLSARLKNESQQVFF